jgi:hypothetical protein
MSPSPPDVGVGGGNGIACPSECAALGNYSNGNSPQLFADELNALNGSSRLCPTRANRR